MGCVENAKAASDGIFPQQNFSRCQGLSLGEPAFRSGYREPLIPDFKVFMTEGGWCWFQDPRAVIHDGKLFIGSVQGHGSGLALVGLYDLNAKRRLGDVVLHDNFDHDDHNAPVFYVRPDGSVLAVYTRHNRENCFYYRISDPENPLKWGEEVKVLTSSKVTYANLYEMKNEGRLYNFFRGIRFDPTFVTSADGGKTWSKDVHFIASELNGVHRPYARYVGNGEDTVHVSFTDAHPRKFGNSIYYTAFRDGKFWKANGAKIKDLQEDGPLAPSEAELVYRGSMTTVKPKGSESVPGAAWTSSISIDAQGYPHIAYTLYKSNIDHRYRLASWDGSQWIDREVACGGKCLYARESSYTGLIALDPVDPSVVVISTDVDPSTGEDLGANHEIYRAKVGLNDDIGTIKWQAVTQNSAVRNIRPIILRDGDRRVILWQRGQFVTFTSYDLATVGFIENITE